MFAIESTRVTPVGHSITGATIAVLSIPRAWRLWVKASLVAAFIVLANVPDLRLPYWGHERYDISHSIFVNTALIVLFSLPLLLSSRFRRLGGMPVLVGVALAWLSHLLLDTFYGHGGGLGMFWPFSKAHVSLAIPWFETLGRPLPHVDSHTARVCLIELLSYGTILVVALVARLVYVKYTNRGQRSHGPDNCGGAS